MSRRVSVQRRTDAETVLPAPDSISGIGIEESGVFRTPDGGLAPGVFWSICAGAAALLAWTSVYAALDEVMINVVNYKIDKVEVNSFFNDQVQKVHAPKLWGTLFVSFLPTLLIVAVTVVQIRRALKAPDPRMNFLTGTPGRQPWKLVLGSVGLVVVGLAWQWGIVAQLWLVGISFVCMGWMVGVLGRPGLARSLWLERPSPLLLALAVAVFTFWHAVQQFDFWQHFLLGYADFGFFTTELEHCLPWKDVGPARFVDTRMGYHAVILFYVLVPFYMLVRSPQFLMVIGPLALNLAAFAFYLLARDRASSKTAGLLAGLAWLLLPSISRLPSSNTYGFQSIYLAVPFLAFCFAQAMRGRWRSSHLCLAAALLCEETVCGVALGWGAYLVIWGGRRRDGVIIMLLSVAYLLFCTLVLIPSFTPTQEYTWRMLFGNLSEGGIGERLARPHVGWYVAALLVPLFPAVWTQWRLLLVALLPLLLMCLMVPHEELNIKYWHQSSILPVFFAAAVLGATIPRHTVEAKARRTLSLGSLLGLLMTVLLFHHWMGSSPMAQADRIYQADPRLSLPDSRQDVVYWVRQRFQPEDVEVLATERMAAHFMDYRMVFPVATAGLRMTEDRPTLLIVDRGDLWDKILVENQLDVFLQQAWDAGFNEIHEAGDVLILERGTGKGRPVNKEDS